MNFPVVGIDSAQLDTLSVFPTIRQDIIAQLISNPRTLKSKNKLLVEQQTKLKHSIYIQS